MKMHEETEEFEKIGEAEAKKLLEKIARVLGFRVAKVGKRWCFETFWKIRWPACNYPPREQKVLVTVNFNDCVGSVFSSAKEQLEMFLEAKTLWWSTGPFSEKSIENPFFNMVSEEALEIKLDLEEKPMREDEGSI